MAGWFKLHRDLLDKPIWVESSPEQRSILITLLMMVNYESNRWEWQGEQYECKPGQVITSLQKIAEKSGRGVSIQNVRTALKRFEKLNFLTNESTNKNRLITVVNWRIYQGGEDETNKQVNTQLTSNQQAANKQLTTIKNIRSKEGKNKELKDIVGHSPDHIPYKEIIDYLNKKADTNYRHTGKKTQTLIKARSNEGFTVEDFNQVIDIKVNEWLQDKTMNKYLRPETLFGTKFESYLNQKQKGMSGGYDTSEYDDFF